MNSLFRRMYQGQEGQVLYLFVALLIVLLGMAALSIDIGFALHAQRELQASTDAAAAAGALDLPCTTSGTPPPSCATLVTDATLYSGTSTNLNAYKDLPNVSLINGTPKIDCVSTTQLTNVLGIAWPPTCPTGSGNAVEVQQQVSVPTFFAKILGISSITLKAKAVALEKGGTPAPANIMVVVDTTVSMGGGDSTCAGSNKSGITNPTRLDCAKWGVRSLLLTLDPCSGAPTAPCGSDVTGTTNVQNALQEVGILTFPGVQTTTDAQNDYTNCGKNMGPTYGQKGSLISQYASPTTYPPYYTVVGLSSDYKASYSSTALSGGTSELVDTVDWADGNDCQSGQYGLQNPGGVGTYYAGVITEAQADLTALNSGNNPRGSMQNAIILLSDGEANAGPTDFVSGTSSTYYKNDCHQAITAAQNAATAVSNENNMGMHTWVYAVAYGSSNNSSDCSTDSPAITPCTAMGGSEPGTQGIASDWTKFYSDDANGCASPYNSSETSLGSIFTKIGYDFLTTRLLPKALYP